MSLRVLWAKVSEWPAWVQTLSDFLRSGETEKQSLTILPYRDIVGYMGRATARRAAGTNLTDEALELIAARFKILSEPLRLKLLHTLGRSEMTVGELVEATGAGQANVSKHLALLHDSGMVSRRKDGLSVYYHVSDQTVFKLCELVCGGIGEVLANQRSALSSYPRRQ